MRAADQEMRDHEWRVGLRQEGRLERGLFLCDFGYATGTDVVEILVEMD
jgi:hypothetical protein